MLQLYKFNNYTWKNARSVTAFNSTDLIRSVQNNVATPVTAMMVTVCISTDALLCIHQSWFIWYVPTASITAVGPSCLLQPVLTDCNVSTCSQHTCIILLPIRLVIQPWQPHRLFHSDTVSSAQSVGDNSLIQLWYHTCIRPEGAKAVTGLWRFCV